MAITSDVEVEQPEPIRCSPRVVPKGSSGRVPTPGRWVLGYAGRFSFRPVSASEILSWFDLPGEAQAVAALRTVEFANG